MDVSRQDECRHRHTEQIWTYKDIDKKHGQSWTCRWTGTCSMDMVKQNGHAYGHASWTWMSSMDMDMDMDM
jgi:hypothetical protein